jgi:nucleoside-diphosphate-sugar epimerase
VRLSVLAPREFIRDNIECTTALFEADRQWDPKIRIVYASSSSVVGRAMDVPFRDRERASSVASVYGATKDAVESIAQVFSHAYGLHVTGLRFFSVYGAWGRPDMAYFSMAELIASGRPITLYRGPENEFPRRDFTHVDDIVAGIDQAVRRVRGPLHAIVNLGRDSPVSSLEMVKQLASLLQKKPVVRFALLPAVDVPETHANLATARRWLNYNPEVDLRQGLESFVAWFSKYRRIKTGLIFTSYFANGKEPQGRIHQNRSFAVYGKHLLTQVERLKLSMVVFLDGAEEAEREIVRVLSSESVAFVSVKLNASRSLNDERFRVYLEYLEQLEFTPMHLLFSGIWDVEICGDPFAEMVRLGFPLFAQPEGMDGCLWMRKRLAACGLQQHWAKEHLCVVRNAGLWDGKWYEALKTLRRVVSILYGGEADPSANCNMPGEYCASRIRGASLFDGWEAVLLLWAL